MRLISLLARYAKQNNRQVENAAGYCLSAVEQNTVGKPSRHVYHRLTQPLHAQPLSSNYLTPYPYPRALIQPKKAQHALLIRSPSPIPTKRVSHNHTISLPRVSSVPLSFRRCHFIAFSRARIRALSEPSRAEGCELCKLRSQSGIGA